MAWGEAGTGAMCCRGTAILAVGLAGVPPTEALDYSSGGQDARQPHRLEACAPAAAFFRAP